MVYEWEGKEADSYRLYVEERRSLDEVMEYWKLRGFTPRFVCLVLAQPPTVHDYGRRVGQLAHHRLAHPS